VLNSKRGTGPNALRRGRYSNAGANYFVTLCVTPRIGILSGEVAGNIAKSAHAMSADATWDLRAFTIMPDHLHLFFTLGDRLNLSQTIARLKSNTRGSLVSASVDWQTNFYDHQLRPDDSVEATIRYIFLNPKQAGLIPASEPWGYFYCCPADWSWFETLTDAGQPFPEWLL
jgi:putative transposase